METNTVDNTIEVAMPLQEYEDTGGMLTISEQTKRKIYKEFGYFVQDEKTIKPEIVSKFDILIDDLLKWCDDSEHSGNHKGLYMNFTFGDLKELLIKIRDSEYYKSLKNTNNENKGTGNCRYDLANRI